MSSFGHDDKGSTPDELAEAMKRISALQAEGKMVEALEVVRTTAGRVFGTIRQTLDQVDAESAARLLGSLARIHAAAGLLAAEGELYQLRDENNRARACYRRALEFYLEGVLLDPEVPEPIRAAMAALRLKSDEWRLGARYQKVLATL